MLQSHFNIATLMVKIKADRVLLIRVKSKNIFTPEFTSIKGFGSLST